MIVIELTSGDLYTAELESYDIIFKDSSIEVRLNTNRGYVVYNVTAAHDSPNDLESMRDDISKKLNTGFCRIKEYPERDYLFFDALQFTGTRVGTDYLP